MNICGCVVHASAGRGPEVARRAQGLAGVEVHGGVAEDRLVVTVEDTAQTLAADTLGALRDLEDVIGTTLVYHYGGDDIPDPSPAPGATANEIPPEEHPHDHHPA
jgi:nitrate reductase NapD